MLLLIRLLESHNLLFSHVDLILVLLNFVLRFLKHFLLIIRHIVQFLSHFFDLLGLSMVDIALPRDLFLARLNVCSCIFIFLGQLFVVFTTLSKLDLNIPQ